MKTKIEELIKAGELATGGEWAGKYCKLSDQCPTIGDENSVLVNLSANARPAIKAMYEENVRLREALVDADKYLDANHKLNSIGRNSILHKNMKQAIRGGDDETSTHTRKKR